MFGWTADEAMSFRLLDAWVDAGMNFVDTADVYSRWVPGHAGGESETIIGNWLKPSGKRDRVVLATKVGKPMGDATRACRKAYIRRAVEASLRRLQTDYRPLPVARRRPATPLEETLDAFAELIQAGKVRAIGASNYTAARLALALDDERGASACRATSRCSRSTTWSSAQPTRAELEPVCARARRRRHQLLRAGERLPDRQVPQRGRPRQERRAAAAPGKYLNERGLAVLAALDAVAATVGATPAQVALAWQIARPGITAPIASATSPAQLAGLVDAAALTPRHAVDRADRSRQPADRPS